MARRPTRAIRPTPPDPTPPPAIPNRPRRRTTGEFTKHMLAETWEAILIIGCHTAVVAAILLAGYGVEMLGHTLHNPAAAGTVGQQAVGFGIQVAETVTAYGLIVIGTISALWTFLKRRRED